MNKDVEAAKLHIAGAFNDALTVEAAAEIYYDLRRFVTKAFEHCVQNINDELLEENQAKVV